MELLNQLAVTKQCGGFAKYELNFAIRKSFIFEDI